MEDLKEKYKQVQAQRNSINTRINELKDNELLKEYFTLCKESKDLTKQQIALYKQIKAEEYSSCNHIWVIASQEVDNWEGRAHNYYGCIKCGLDKRLLSNYKLKFLLPLREKTMYDFIKKNAPETGIITNIFCDLDLAKSIYSKIKAAHPDIDDETAIKYLQSSLHYIREKKISNERKEDRARRLFLNPKFNKWGSRDVIE